MTNAAVSLGVQIPVQVPVFSSFGYKLRSGISGSHGNSRFTFLKNHHAVFHSSCTILDFQQCSTAQGFQFLCILDNIGYSWHFDSSHPHGCEVVAHGGFSLAFP